MIVFEFSVRTQTCGPARDAWLLQLTWQKRLNEVDARYEKKVDVLALRGFYFVLYDSCGPSK